MRIQCATSDCARLARCVAHILTIGGRYACFVRGMWQFSTWDVWNARIAARLKSVMSETANLDDVHHLR